MQPRPPIPKELERQLKIEAGHRCAIPTCRHPRIQLAHIEPWAKVQEHRFENMIALCPNCHDRFDNTKEIDRKSMRLYKTNLAIVTGRYGDLERRVLEAFAENPRMTRVELPGSLGVLMSYLQKDGLVVFDGQTMSVEFRKSGTIVAPTYYKLTEKGREFINRWVANKALD